MGSIHSSIRLADTSVRLFKKRDGRTSLWLRSYLVIPGDFRLSAYLQAISARVELPVGDGIALDTILYGEDCHTVMGHMLYTFRASGVTDLPVRRHRAARLVIDYRLNFTGHPDEPSARIDVIVPLIDRT